MKFLSVFIDTHDVRHVLNFGNISLARLLFEWCCCHCTSEVRATVVLLLRLLSVQLNRGTLDLPLHRQLFLYRWCFNYDYCRFISFLQGIYYTNKSTDSVICIWFMSMSGFTRPAPVLLQLGPSHRKQNKISGWSPRCYCTFYINITVTDGTDCSKTYSTHHFRTAKQVALLSLPHHNFAHLPFCLYWLQEIYIYTKFR
jgi:hypothetical protein